MPTDSLGDCVLLLRTFCSRGGKRKDHVLEELDSWPSGSPSALISTSQLLSCAEVSLLKGRGVLRVWLGVQEPWAPFSMGAICMASPHNMVPPPQQDFSWRRSGKTAPAVARRNCHPQ